MVKTGKVSGKTRKDYLVVLDFRRIPSEIRNESVHLI